MGIREKSFLAWESPISALRKISRHCWKIWLPGKRIFRIPKSGGTSEKIIEQILGGSIDVGLVSLPVEASDVLTETLRSDRLVAATIPQHKLARSRMTTAEELASEQLILGEKGGNTRRLIDQFFAHAGVALQVSMELSRQAAIRRMVEEDMGVGIVPLQSVADEVERGRLVRWWIEGAQINWELGIARLTGGYESPITQTFIKLSRDHFAASRRPTAKKPKPAPGKKRSRK